MRTVDDYCDLAKNRHGFSSDAELSRRLGNNRTLVNFWRTKRAWPSDHVMVQLADLAGVKPEVALIELAIWRTTDDARPLYQRILSTLTKGAAAVLLAFGLSTLLPQHGKLTAPAPVAALFVTTKKRALTYFGNSLYIMATMLRRLLRRISSGYSPALAA